MAALVSAVQVLLFLAVVLIALRGGRFPRRTGQIIAVVLLLGSAAAAILELVDNNGPGAGVASLWTVLDPAAGRVPGRAAGLSAADHRRASGVVSTYMRWG